MLNSPKVNKIFSSEKMKRFLLWFAAISLLGTLAFLLKDVSPHADTKNVYEGAVLLNQGAAETDSGNYEAALVLFNKALPMLDNKNKFKVYYNIGRTYNEKREPGKALINLDKSIELNSFCTYCFGERGRAYSQLEKADKAIENYTKAIELEPNNYIAYVNRAIEYSQINQEDKSMIDLKHAIVLSSDNPAVYIDLITSLMYNKKYTEAQEYINQFKLIIKSDDSFNYEQYLLFQSKLYYNLDDYKNLIPFAQEAIDKYKTNYLKNQTELISYKKIRDYAYYCLIDAYFKTEKYEMSIKNLYEVLELAKKNNDQENIDKINAHIQRVKEKSGQK